MHPFTSILFCFNQDEEEGWKMAPSAFVPAVNEGTETYKGMVMIKLKYMLLLFCLFVAFVVVFSRNFCSTEEDNINSSSKNFESLYKEIVLRSFEYACSNSFCIVALE